MAACSRKSSVGKVTGCKTDGLISTSGRSSDKCSPYQHVHTWSRTHLWWQGAQAT